MSIFYCANFFHIKTGNPEGIFHNDIEFQENSREKYLFQKKKRTRKIKKSREEIQRKNI